MFINLDEYVDIDSFISSAAREMCIGISKGRKGLCHPGSRATGIEGYPDLKHPYEFENFFKEQDSDYLKDLDHDQIREYIKYYYKIHYPVENLHIKIPKTYHTRHTELGSKYTENAKHFPNLIDWIENKSPFKEVSRIQLFILNSFAKLTAHRDSIDDDYTNKPDMLWFSIDKNAMRFWIKDGDKKYYPDCTCAWFDENQEHGSDGVADATFCLRLDGTFRKDWDALHFIYGH